MKDMMHKISTDIVRYCAEHGVGTVVMGVNRGWKQGSDMGKVNNQNFTGIPHDRLRKMIMYKAAREGIRIMEQEESYTSKADITAMDFIPVYGRENGNVEFSGRRIKRGLYACSPAARVIPSMRTVTARRTSSGKPFRMRGKERRISGSLQLRRQQDLKTCSACGPRKDPQKVFLREGCGRSRRIGGSWTVPDTYGRPETSRKRSERGNRHGGQIS